MYEDITGEYDLFSTLDTTYTDNKKSPPQWWTLSLECIAVITQQQPQ